MPDERRLNVVDGDGNIVGEETREKIHRDGLLHKEIFIIFYTPKGEIIFQHRAKDKDTFPDKLDIAVGGHVEMGEDFLTTALNETAEETGLKLKPSDLQYIKTLKVVSYDRVTGKTNNSLRACYSYLYGGDVGDLKVEDGKACGFEAYLIDKLLVANEEERSRFIPGIFSEEVLEMFINIREMRLNKGKIRETTLLFLVKKEQGVPKEICLAMKKVGFGAGRWNGVGGKVENNESVEDATRRETEEEIGVKVKEIEKVAEISFSFPAEPEWNQSMHTYWTESWQGEPKETEEMRPRWFPVDKIPYDLMWPDDIFWLPEVLKGNLVRASFTFSEGDIIKNKEVKTVDHF